MIYVLNQNVKKVMMTNKKMLIKRALRNGYGDMDE